VRCVFAYWESMPSPDLPLEICDIIVDILDCTESRTETLKTCSLISKAWAASAQRRIFHTIYIVDALRGSASTMTQTGSIIGGPGALLSQISQSPFSAPSRKAPDLDSNVNSNFNSNSGFSIPLAKLCEVLKDSHHLRPFVKKVQINISDHALSNDVASSLLTEWLASNELALSFLFQLETLPELRHLSLQLPYRVGVTALGSTSSILICFEDFLISKPNPTLR
jgi:hypothetical protein